MSQTLNHIEWCLNKAGKELKEGKKHRGLVKIKPAPPVIKTSIYPPILLNG